MRPQRKWEYGEQITWILKDHGEDFGFSTEGYKIPLKGLNND